MSAGLVRATNCLCQNSGYSKNLLNGVDGWFVCVNEQQLGSDKLMNRNQFGLSISPCWRSLCTIVVLLVGHGAHGAHNAHGGETIVEWNEIASDVLLADTQYQNPGMASRSMAMVNLAIYDAVNGIQPTHQSFFSQPAPQLGASPDVAAIEAAYQVLSSIYPGQQAMLDSRRTASMSAFGDSPAKTSGILYGQQVASTILNERVNDGFDEMVPYSLTEGAGHWEPDPMNPGQEAWGPEWGSLKPFGIREVSDMMPPPMPSMTSDEYTAAFNEVKRLGSIDSTERTADQTEIALFWAYDRLGMGTPMRLYNQVLRNIATSEETDLNETARMFAMAHTSIADAGITAWDAKFEYDFWRPISGIRRADEDGNPNTVADPDWTPLAAPGGTGPDGELINDFTPPFPTYISGHASFGGALFQSLENYFGTDEMSFQLTSDEVPGSVRSFERFSDARIENGRSRVFLGIHWDFDDTMAQGTGQLVADYIHANHFAPVPEPDATIVVWVGLFGVAARMRHRRR